MEEIIIEESNYRAFALTMANLLMFLASAAFMIFGFVKGKLPYWLFGMIAALVFLTGFIVAVAKAVKVKALLTIKIDGIIDNSPLGGFGFISFDDIKEFQIVNMYRGRVIAVIPKDVESFLTKLSLIKRRQLKRNIMLKLPPISINTELAKDMEPEDILSLLQKRLMDYSSLYE